MTAKSGWIPIAVLLCLLSCAGAAQAGGHTGSTVVLISIDGFRWDFADMTDTPSFDRLQREGAKAHAVRPAFPTLTFPNHMSIATGVYPQRHGIVANDFPDETRQHWYHSKQRETVQNGQWYLAEPIWVTAEKHGIPTAAYYFVGTEADIGGIRPGRWRDFDEKISARQRVDTVIEWLSEPADQRPGFITLYFDQVDNHTHWYGIGTKESRRQIREIDRQIGRLLTFADRHPGDREIHLVVVSDHGQAGYAAETRPLVLDQLVSLEGVRSVNTGTMVSLYFPTGSEERILDCRDRINASWNCGLAMRPGETPPGWRVDNSPRYPDLFVVGDPGCGVVSDTSWNHKITPGDHGWPPEHPDMHGIFYAWGPRISRGFSAGTIDIVDIHPFLLRLLGLPSPATTDADPAALAGALLSSMNQPN